MNTNLIVSQINSLTEFPADAIIVSYHNHYRWNNLDFIQYTDNNGCILNSPEFVKSLYNHWNEDPDDIGVICITALTHERGAFAARQGFATLCGKYISASNQLEEFDEGELLVNNCYHTIEGFDGNSMQKQTKKFEDTLYYKKYHKLCKPSTLAKKKAIYVAEQKKYNEEARALLVKNKEEAKKWFDENHISVRVAYLFFRR